MARLTKADAARQLHISRTTLYKLIDQGKLSATPDGLIDTAELVRVAPTVDVQTRRPLTPLGISTLDAVLQGSGQDERPSHTSSLNSEQAGSERQPTSIERALGMVREQMQLMRDELQAAREERALLLHMLQEMQHRYDRLLEAPRSAPVAPGGPAMRAQPQTAEARGALRRQILILLQDYPDGLTPTQMRECLQVEKSLANTCIGMYRRGLLRRVSHGRYVATEGATPR